MSNQIQSARNGLIITVPTQARGVLRRFASSGDNELIFAKMPENQTKPGRKRAAKPEGPMTLESPASEDGLA